MAGFLYLMTKSESKSFTLLKHLIAHGNMAGLFDTSTPMLKMSFYRLDRLISICIPEMHVHFKVSLYFCLIYLFLRVGGKHQQ